MLLSSSSLLLVHNGRTTKTTNLMVQKAESESEVEFEDDVGDVQSIVVAVPLDH